MLMKRTSKLVVVLAALALFATACGDGDDGSTSPQVTALPAVEDTVVEDTPVDTTPEEVSMTPGEGVSVTMGRANWNSGYFQAEIYGQLFAELGYDVSDPAELELGPNNAYIAMAEGQMDFWTNSWYPLHLSWIAGELPDGALVGDHLTVVGEEMIAGGIQGRSYRCQVRVVRVERSARRVR